MKVTIENFPFRDKFGDKRAFEMIKNAGFDGVDFSFNALDADGNWGSIDLSNHLNTAKEQKKMLVSHWHSVLLRSDFTYGLTLH